MIRGRVRPLIGRIIQAIKSGDDKVEVVTRDDHWLLKFCEDGVYVKSVEVGRDSSQFQKDYDFPLTSDEWRLLRSELLISENLRKGLTIEVPVE